MSRFLDALRSGRVLLMDGAMGTELQCGGAKVRGERRTLEFAQAGHGSGDPPGVPRRRRVRPPDQHLPGDPRIHWRTHQTVAGLGPTLRRRQDADRPPAERLRPGPPATGPDGFVLADIGSFVNKTDGNEFSDFSLLNTAAGASATWTACCWKPARRSASSGPFAGFARSARTRWSSFP